jgi:hypothetical protein
MLVVMFEIDPKKGIYFFAKFSSVNEFVTICYIFVHHEF